MTKPKAPKNQNPVMQPVIFVGLGGIYANKGPYLYEFVNGEWTAIPPDGLTPIPIDEFVFG